MDRPLSPNDPQWSQNIAENLILRSTSPTPAQAPISVSQIPRVLGPRPFLPEHTSEPPLHTSQLQTPHSPEQDSVHQRPSQSTLRDPNAPDPSPGLWANRPKDLEQPLDYTRQYPHAYEQDQLWNRRQKGTPWWSTDDEDGFYSVGCLLFLFGFICPPLWWIGSFWPKHARELGGKMAERWQRLNRCMSIGFSILLIIALIVLGVLESREKH
ncbi:hypothetical protein F4703DRAFT_1064164 [Phycomyces blakesleeanus]